MFNGMAHVSIGVTDLDRSISFYRDTLGMTVTGRRELPTGVMLVTLSGGNDTEVELTYIPTAGERAPVDPAIGLRHIAFFVSDIDESVATLKAKGIAFHREPSPKGSAIRVAFFRDPDGVDIELVEKR